MMSDQTASFIKMDQVTFRYFEQGRKEILDQVSLEIPRGQITLIAGSSGCGKSTLAAVAAGLYPENGGVLSGGQVFLMGNPVNEMNPAVRSRYLSMMFQNPDLQFCMDTLRKEMRFCLENISVPREEMDSRLEKQAESLKLTGLLDRKLYTLSGGEKQKAALACLFLLESQGVLLDEPFANIDEEAAREIIGWLVKGNREQGLSVTAIDHRLDYWLPVADEVIVLGAGGRVLARGINQKNFQEYRQLFDREGLYYPGKYKRQPQLPGPEEPAIVLEQADIGGLLCRADAVIPRGRITGILGPSGCGKTTLFRTLSGEKKYGGSLKLAGSDGLRELKQYRPKELFQTLGVVFQNPSNQFITQNVLEEVLASLRRWQKGSEEELRARAEELLKAYGLERYRKYSPYMLSQGQQRRLAVLSMLAGKQKILLLDEPTYGQDYRSTMVIMEQLLEKTRKEGLTVLMATHDQALAEAVCHRIYRVSGQNLQQVRREGES